MLGEFDLDVSSRVGFPLARRKICRRSTEAEEEKVEEGILGSGGAGSLCEA